jgi:DNA repair exonuclease SbcCD nuclease subunit|tara:strand:- start:901 stop:1941 length:1041 start_codon:yes stop_codon:yes gene_type:complete
MKVAIITDQHFGFKKGSKLFHEYFQKFYEEVFFPTLQERGITTVIDMGDTFDSRKGIDLYSLDWAQRNYFDRIRDLGITLHSVVGNHTAFYKNTNEVNTIDLLLREYDNVNTITECTDIDIDGCKICMVPWINSDNSEYTYKMIRESSAKVAMGHLELNGFYAHHGYTMEDGDDIQPYQKFDRVFSGHYHTRSSDGRIFYLGNPYEMFWNDVGDPRGFHIFDTETYELETINNPFQMFRVIKYDDTPRQLFKFAEYKDKIVKLIVVNKSSQKEYDRFVDALSSANPYDLKIIEKTSEMDFGEDAAEQTEDTLTLLDKFVDELETDLSKAKIKSLVKDLYRQACEVM